VISIGGRLGTVHEFTIAMETDTPIAFMQGAGGISTEIMDILHAAGESRNHNMIFGEDADELVKELIELLNKEHKKYRKIYA
jgi:hypothetical protein